MPFTVDTGWGKEAVALKEELTPGNHDASGIEVFDIPRFKPGR